jgi:hypothetical protein
LYVFATVQGGANGIVTYVGAAPTGGFTTPAAGVAISGAAAGLAVH